MTLNRWDIITIPSSLHTGNPPVLPASLEIKQLRSQLDEAEHLDELFRSIAVQAANLSGAAFSRVVVQELDGSWVVKAFHLRGANTQPRLTGKPEPPYAQLLYQQLVARRQTTVLKGSEDIHSFTERQALELSTSTSLCLTPMNAGEDNQGILILGQRGEKADTFFTPLKVQLSTAIAIQAAEAIIRACHLKVGDRNRLQSVLALAKTVETRDHYTAGHSQRIVDLAERIARRLNLPEPEVQAIRWATMLHDVGKIGVPDDVLRRPGPLTPMEWNLIRRHPDMGADIVIQATNQSHIGVIIRSHHERYDGSGYPRGLTGEQIPIGARILAVVDAYGAMVDGRSYQPPRSRDEALTEIVRCGGSQFDPRIVQAFLSVMQELIR